ncbi:MAG: Rpn family recombination-promoting nuclease/putative transposase [Desulfovibrionaceae bacterium]|nr:Rpn family recombination-promoting nuclease/putative transposase [Desulfovibrionaceae bacterium]
MTSKSDISPVKPATKNSEKQKKGKEGPKWRDASYKLLYTFPEMVSDLLTGFIPEELIGQIDKSTLKREPDTFINKHLSERREDRIWSVRTTKGCTRICTCTLSSKVQVAKRWLCACLNTPQSFCSISTIERFSIMERSIGRFYQ